MNDSFITNCKCIDHASTHERRSQVVQAHLHFRGKGKKTKSLPNFISTYNYIKILKTPSNHMIHCEFKIVLIVIIDTFSNVAPRLIIHMKSKCGISYIIYNYIL